MTEFHVIAEHLEFPEGGPVCLSDGSFLVVEIKGQTLTRVYPNGRKEVVAKLSGGPNSSAVGADEKIYVTNNGGFAWHVHDLGDTKLTIPGDKAADYKTGSIQRVDLITGKVETLFTSGSTSFGSSKIAQLRGPNDLVFDKLGGFYFTDLGKSSERSRDKGGVFYARRLNSSVKPASDQFICSEVVFPMDTPNGIGLSIDGKKLYVAETITGRLYVFDIISAGKVTNKRLLYSAPDEYKFDSLAVDGEDNIVVATLGSGRHGTGGLSVISKKGELREFICTNDPLTTNVSFNNKGEAIITSSGFGKLLKCKWKYKTRQPNFEDGFNKFITETQQQHKLQQKQQQQQQQQQKLKTSSPKL